MKTISLPAYAFEERLPDLLNLLDASNEDAEVILDFQSVKFWTPGALVSLLAKIHSWRNQKKEIVFRNHEECKASRYLQRINFFSLCGLKIQEDFNRHGTNNRFVELRRIGGEDKARVEDISTDIADCLFPDANVDDPDQSGLFDLLQYSVSELASNVFQHARASGFAMAQYTGQTDLIRVAIADAGIGVLRSFEENGSPYWKQELTDADAIALALQPKVSSKAHVSTAWGEPINAGVGLTLLKKCCSITDGHFFMASGNGACFQCADNDSLQQLRLRNNFQGTLCALSFKRQLIRNFMEMLDDAKQAVGLLSGDNKFGSFFT